MVQEKLVTDQNNGEIVKKEPLYISDSEHLEVIKEYTRVHSQYSDEQKLEREMACLNVLFPKVFRPMYSDDLILGRFDALAIGFGSVTSVGGPGHYCRFDQLENLRLSLASSTNSVSKEIDQLISYWQDHDTREVFYKAKVKGNIVGRFVVVDYPVVVTARFSGIYLKYNLLLDFGIDALKDYVSRYADKNLASTKQYEAMIKALELLQEVIDYHIKEVMTKLEIEPLSPKRRMELERLLSALKEIRHNKPTSFIGAMQLAWLYSSLTGVINFGRMDDYLGDYLISDLERGVLTEEEAISLIESQWRLIEVKRTIFNGRVVLGGKGRRNPNNADKFCLLAIKATRRAKMLEPQVTLRIYNGMNEDIYQDALDSISDGLTYPILYNDDVNIPAVMNAMRLTDEAMAEQYVPLGCGEFTLSGQGLGTPNSCINLLKTLTILLNDGIDPWDKLYKYGDRNFTKMADIKTFEELFEQYKKLLHYYVELSADAHSYSYQSMNKQVGFVYASLLTDDCISRGKMILEGGVKHLGGTNETYGNMNTADSLVALKKLVFEEKSYSLLQVQESLLSNFDNNPKIREAMLACPKFGNDDDYADSIAVELHEFVCNTMSEQAKIVGLDSYLVVLINNQVNTGWGRATGASPDGRISGLYMSNANNPQSGADVNGPTAMLNSLVKIKANIHGGSVQNIKFSPSLFKNDQSKIKALFSTFFKKGGPQLMVTVVNRDELEKAYHNPAAYQNLTVRVGGFSAKFVNLEDDVQREIMARSLNE